MSLTNYTPAARSNKYINLNERSKIEGFLNDRLKPKDIAKRLGRHTRTIEREIIRGTIRLLNSDLTHRDVYCADAAQRIYESNARNKGPTLKIGHDHKLARHIEKKIKEDKYSPDAVIGEIKNKGLKFETIICTKTLYNYIEQDVFAKISNKDLPVKKNKKKGKYRKVRISYKNLKGTSIEDRPGDVDERVEYGHWEMDCVVGKRDGKGAVLLVLSERQTRQEMLFKMPGKTQDNVKKIIDKLEKSMGRRFKEKFKTITVDNGSEFLDFKGIESSCVGEENRVKVYYAHPYSSWERGTNENSNKLIRRFIPKGANIDDYTVSEIKRIEHWMNNYPRRIFGYKTANEMAS